MRIFAVTILLFCGVACDQGSATNKDRNLAPGKDAERDVKIPSNNPSHR